MPSQELTYPIQRELGRSVSFPIGGGHGNIDPYCKSPWFGKVTWHLSSIACMTRHSHVCTVECCKSQDVASISAVVCRAVSFTSTVWNEIRWGSFAHLRASRWAGAKGKGGQPTSWSHRCRADVFLGAEEATQQLLLLRRFCGWVSEVRRPKTSLELSQ